MSQSGLPQKKDMDIFREKKKNVSLAGIVLFLAFCVLFFLIILVNICVFTMCSLNREKNLHFLNYFKLESYEG